VTGAYEDVVAKLTPQGQATVFPLQPGCYAWDIASGNGALWVPCDNAALVYRVSRQGAITSIKVPSGSTENNSIVRAPNGSIWSTETAVNILAKITG
jgi:streptogramin lyase